MSAENELTALRSNGVSIPRACVPVLGLAIVFTGICLWINLSVAPLAQKQMKDALFNIATSNPLAMFGTDKVIEDFPGHVIYVEKSEGSRLSNLLVYKIDEPTKELKSVMFAREGRLELGSAMVKNSKGVMEEEKQLILKLID